MKFSKEEERWKGATVTHNMPSLQRQASSRDFAPSIWTRGFGGPAQIFFAGYTSVAYQCENCDLKKWSTDHTNLKFPELVHFFDNASHPSAKRIAAQNVP